MPRYDLEIGRNHTRIGDYTFPLEFRIAGELFIFSAMQLPGQLQYTAGYYYSRNGDPLIQFSNEYANLVNCTLVAWYRKMVECQFVPVLMCPLSQQPPMSHETVYEWRLDDFHLRPKPLPIDGLQPDFRTHILLRKPVVLPMPEFTKRP